MVQHQISTVTCHICNKGNVFQLPEYSGLNRVTSDSKPWQSGGFLGVCEYCGTAQKSIDATWLAEIDHIYKQYTIYYQGKGTEQKVFAPSGESMTRSSQLVTHLLERDWLSPSGRLLDVGCGNGSLLRVFSERLSGWQLAGTELSDKYRPIVENIPNVEALYVGPPEEVPGQFDLVTLVHVLEHIAHPETFLRALHQKLNRSGKMLIEVPFYLNNPYDLLIADHSTHFTPQSLKILVEQNGYQLETVATDWIPKEISAVFRTSSSSNADGKPVMEPTLDLARDCIAWLHEVVRTAKIAALHKPFGLFGTSIAATWLCSELGDLVEFFVDEDPNRIGQTHLGHPVHHPSEVDIDSTVFIAISPMQIVTVKQRMGNTYPGLNWTVPPMFIPTTSD